jgi:hypothetical protein
MNGTGRDKTEQLQISMLENEEGISFITVYYQWVLVMSFIFNTAVIFLTKLDDFVQNTFNKSKFMYICMCVYLYSISMASIKMTMSQLF